MPIGNPFPPQNHSRPTQTNDWHIHLMPMAFPLPKTINEPPMQANDWHTHLMPITFPLPTSIHNPSMQANAWHTHLMPISISLTPQPLTNHQCKRMIGTPSNAYGISLHHKTIHNLPMQANDWHTHLMPTGIFFHPQTFIYHSINALEFRLNNYSKKTGKKEGNNVF